ncbi:MAG: S41 family peptidase [Verrucomicrobia bacterium]|nr:S41 family peptidase [Verrucomicrobiota bacterium]
MKKRLFYGLLLAALGVNLLLGTHLYFTTAHAAEKDDPYLHYKLFTTVLEKVRAEYVDGDKASYQSLVSSALKGMIATLDPHSEFMEARKYDELRKDTEGVFGGVGIVVGLKDNAVTVIAPMDETPAAGAGVLSGDRIVKIDGKSAAKFTLNDAVQNLRGKPGTDVTITFFRPSNGETREVKLTRAVIKVATVKDVNGKSEYPLLDDQVGYVRLAQFGERTSAELGDVLKKLEAKGMKALVLDLRDNPGGLLDQAVKVCEKFVPPGQLVVTTEGRDEKSKDTYKSTARATPTVMPRVVLVNGGSASASEIVAGCLQDLADKTKAIVIGEQTFGKGSVQSILPLPDGAALRLTTAKYYTPSHKVIHEKGITPDILVPMSDEQERDLALKRSPGGADALDEKDRERVKNARDLQLERALDVLKGIAFYSQGLKAEKKVSSRK